MNHRIWYATLKIVTCLLFFVCILSFNSCSPQTIIEQQIKTAVNDKFQDLERSYKEKIDSNMSSITGIEKNTQRVETAAQNARKHSDKAAKDANDAAKAANAATELANAASAKANAAHENYVKILGSYADVDKKINELIVANIFWMQIVFIIVSVLGIFKVLFFILPFISRCVLAWCLKVKQPEFKVNTEVPESLKLAGGTFACDHKLSIDVVSSKKLYVRKECISKFPTVSRPRPSFRAGLKGGWFARY